MNAARICIGVSLMLLTAVLTSTADVPHMINYQGRLTNPDGDPVDTTVDITFRIYADEGGASQIWQELHTDVVFSDGLCEVLLGSITPLTTSILDGSERWLGIQVGSNDVSMPLTAIVSGAYAIRSSHADTASFALAGAGGNAVWTDEGTSIHPSTLTDSVGIGTDDPSVPLEVEGPVIAILGHSLGTGLAIGVFGANDNDGVGLLGTSMSGKGVHGISTTGYGGYFYGPMNYFSDNLGIGTETPEEMLHVYENYTGANSFVKIQSDHATNWGEAGLEIETPLNHWRLYMDDDDAGEITAGGLGIYNGSTDEVVFTIAPTGNFGVGRIPMSSTRFAVSSSSEALRGECTGDGIGVHGSSETGWGGYFVAPKHYFSGLVGLGTLTPTHRLSVNNGAIALLDDGDAKFHINYYNNGFNISETTVADYRFFIKPGGNVGIGTSSPSQKLHVNGNAHIAGTLHADAFEANAINKDNILDDVGIASAASTTYDAIGTSYSAFLTREITVPASGYILATGCADVSLDHGITGSSAVYLAFSDIEDNLNGAQWYSPFLGDNVGAGTFRFTASFQRLFYVPSQGTYTYYMIASRLSGNDASIYHRQMDLLYIRTVYASKDGGLDLSVPEAAEGSDITMESSDVLGINVTSDQVEIDRLRNDVAVLQDAVAELKARLKATGK
jgi:hypothetical protein